MLTPLNVILVVTMISANTINGDNLNIDRTVVGTFATTEACKQAGNVITAQIPTKVSVIDGGDSKIMKLYSNQSFECVSRSIDY